MSARFAQHARTSLLRRTSAAALALALTGATASRAAEPAASWGRRSPARALPATAAPEDLGLAKPLPPAAPVLPKFGGVAPHPMSCGDLSLVLDGFGGFGSASAGGDAFFEAGTGPRATVFEAMAHLRNAGFLDADSLSLPQSEAHSREEGGAVIASYVRGPFRFDLVSRLVDCASPHAAALEQEWTITNVSARAQGLVLSSYVDGDLFFAGDFRDDFGVRTEEALWQFDARGPREPVPYLKLTTEAPEALAVTREVGEYADQRRRINRNLIVRDGLFRGDGRFADLDGDGVTDEGFDVSLAVAHDFGQVVPGRTVRVLVRLEWGLGRVQDVVPPSLAVSLGEDRVVECEGHEGTLVSMTAAAEPADAVQAWQWLVDGALASDEAEPSLLLAPGTHEILVRVTDDEGTVAEDAALVTVTDTVAPEADVSGEVVLWPPDHRLVRVDLPVVLRDACSGDATLRPLSVSVNEPADVRHGGDGKTTADWAIIGGAVYLRRERQGAGAGREYRVTCEAVDAAGNATEVVVIARVPHGAN